MTIDEIIAERILNDILTNLYSISSMSEFAALYNLPVSAAELLNDRIKSQNPQLN